MSEMRGMDVLLFVLQTEYYYYWETIYKNIFISVESS